MCVCVSLCAKDEYLSPFITVLFLAAEGKVEMGWCARDFWGNLSDFATQFFGDDGTFHPKRNSPMYTRVPIFALLSFCAALLSHGMFLFWAVITVIVCVPFCMSSTLD